MTRAAILASLAVFGGFALGFLWGQGTRRALPDATQTDFSGGVLTVKVDATRALSSGLAALVQ